MKRILIVTSILLLVIAAATLSGKESQPEADSINAKHLKALLEMHTRNLDTTAIFLPASRCKGCHGHDPLGNANVTLDGIDINLFDDWETSMMGLAGVDPAAVLDAGVVVLADEAGGVRLGGAAIF